MMEYDIKEEFLQKKKVSKYKNYIDNGFPKSNQLDFMQVRSIVLIVVNLETYNKCKDNKVKLLILLALTSFNEEGKDTFETEEVIKRINIIAKYFNINSPEIIDNAVYFKPDMNKMKELLQKSMTEIKENKMENVLFKI
ncbi:hypothetical protein [Clostridium lundense]|uniref:hypothetical protein n=1 Tax=Clostridium lundense TaxID=319475 RepID=UPI000480E8A6|nr:hypothetical protein [Clostridium lundense]